MNFNKKSYATVRMDYYTQSVSWCIQKKKIKIKLAFGEHALPISRRPFIGELCYFLQNFRGVICN